MFDNSVSASRPWIAFKSCASSSEYSAFKARDCAVTVTFSIENAICWNAVLPSEPKYSAVAVGKPIPVVKALDASLATALVALSVAVLPEKP